MYKFTNGIVVFDKNTRDAYLKAGYNLIETKSNCNNKIKDVANDLDNEVVENENTPNNGVIKTKPRRSKKTSK